MADIKQLESALIKADAAGNADDARVLAAEIRKLRSATPEEAAPAVPQEPYSLGKDLGRQLGLTARYGLEGVGSSLDFLASPIRGALNMAGANIQPGGGETLANAIGLPKPRTETERVVGDMSRFAASAAAPMAAAGKVANTATGATQAVASQLAMNPVSQIASAASSGGADALTKEMGGGQGARTAAALAAGILTPMAIDRVGANLATRNSLGSNSPVSRAQEAGYVIPPSQARPTTTNRAIEGFAGKVSTAQNASARNQPITNELARKAIGAADLSPQGISQVRQAANSAYDELGKVGAFKADANFAQALDSAGASSAALRKNFPELVNSEIDSVVNGLKSRSQFDAQPTIEAIKQFRASGSANRISTDPAKKALGQAQNKIAAALEDMIERNLMQTGDTALLNNYRNARQTLAKTYSVEKALNPATGGIDAAKLAAELKKGKPLSGELKTIAEFALNFPKAAQRIEGMGSLPQISPLDFGAMGLMSAATTNPAMMAGVLARPAARKLALSPMIQNSLGRPMTAPMQLNNLGVSPAAFMGGMEE